jgi:hypothetical protein
MKRESIYWLLASEVRNINLEPGTLSPESVI